MSNKAWERVNLLDRKLRVAFGTNLRMFDGTLCTIEFFGGFEKFNTRPHHNYESWGFGYRITHHDKSIIVESEDLDDAIFEFCAKLEWRNFYEQIAKANTPKPDEYRSGSGR